MYYETFASLANQLNEVANLDTTDQLDESTLQTVIQKLTTFPNAQVQEGMVLLPGKSTKKIPPVKVQTVAKMLATQLENNIESMLAIELDGKTTNNIFIKQNQKGQ